MFYHNLEILDYGLHLTFQVNWVPIKLDQETLSKILSVTKEGIRSTRREKRSIKFVFLYGSFDSLNIQNFKKRVHKREL